MAEEQTEEKPAAADDGAPEPKSKKKLIVIIAGAVVLAAAIGGGAFFMLSGDESEATMAAEAPIKPMTESEGQEGDKKAKDGNSEKAEEGEHVDKPTGTPQEGEAKGSTKGAESEEDFDFGDSLKLDTFNLNLGNPLENRYIRLDVSLEYKGGEAQKKELVKRTPQIRDVVVTVVSRKTREFLLSPDGKSQLRKELLTRINRYMSRPIESVYITDILIE